MIELPKTKVKAVTSSPNKFMYYSSPKVGKSTSLAMLDNCLILDFEKGTSFIDALKVDITSLDDLREVSKQIKEAGNPYKFIAVDTVTKLEDFSLELANTMYRESAIGKNFDPNTSVLTLPSGAGYYWLRMAFQKLLNVIYSLSDKTILVGHLKDKMIGTESREVTVKDIDLSGKIKNITAADMDAIGVMKREDNKTILSFKTSEDTVCGSRCNYLSNTDVVLLEEVDGKLISHWDVIYPELKTKK